MADSRTISGGKLRAVPESARHGDGGQLALSGGVGGPRRSPGDRRLRRGRARARVRHARLRRGRGRPAGARARVPRGDGRRSEVDFASKAFPCTAVLRVFAEEGLAFDVASGGELALALRGGFIRRGSTCTATRSPRPSCARRPKPGARVVVDNFDELDRLERLGASRSRLLLRVTPGVEADTHDAILTGHAGSKFGFGLSDAPAAIERLQAASWRSCAACTCTSARSSSTSRRSGRRSRRSPTLGDFPVYDLGGGLAVAYTPNGGRRASPTTSSTMTPPPTSCSARASSCAGARARAGRQRRRDALHGRDGQARLDGEWLVAVDGGMSDNLRPMLYDAPLRGRPRRPGRREPALPCTVAGKHCESGDVLVRETHLPDPRPGDVLVTPVTGAYGHAMANNYNGVPRAAGGVLRRRRARGWSCAARPSRTCMPGTYRVGLLGPRHGGERVRDAAGRARGRDRRGHRAAPGALRRAHPLARRLRRRSSPNATWWSS